ncbi:MAG: LptF/LptG family permease [Magnetococcales bacterium]|nr:LptF/LptG family permease [Magnetococcales bacterium]
MLTLASLAVLTFLVMLPQVLRLTDFWVNKGASFEVLGRLTALTFPRVLLASLPMALLTGILLCLGRMSQESEIVVLKASGVGLTQMARPFAVLVTGCALLSLWLTASWAPQTRYAFSLLKEDLQSGAAVLFQSQSFQQPMEGLMLYFQGQDAQGGMSGVVIHDARAAKEAVTISARQGRLQRDPQGKLSLMLEHGSRLSTLSDGASRMLHFETLDVDLGLKNRPSPRQGGKEWVEDFTLGELSAAIESAPEPTMRHRARVEWHRRLAMPAATFVLGMLSIPLGLQSHRASRAYGFVVALILLTLHFSLMMAGGVMANSGKLHPVLAYWGPNGTLALLTLYVFVMTARERPMRWAEALAEGLAALPQRLLRAWGRG